MILINYVLVVDIVKGRPCCGIGLTEMVGPCCCILGLFIGNHSAFGLLYKLTFCYWLTMYLSCYTVFSLFCRCDLTLLLRLGLFTDNHTVFGLFVD